MVPPAGASYNDIKCHHEEYHDVDIENHTCIISAEKIHEKYADMPSLLYHACEVECCIGGCDAIEDIADEITDIKTFSEEDEDIVYDVKDDQEDPLCDEKTHDATGETACPSVSESAVKVIRQTADIPERELIIYGIVFGDAPDDDHGREVKFRVDNPFQTEADVYVRYEKKVGRYGNDPACDGYANTGAGCDLEAPEITVGCIEYPNVPPVTIVDVYFAYED
jgi:hypothetical protein